MKKIGVLIAAALLVISLVGCENSLEKQIGDAEKAASAAEEVYQKAQDRLDRVKELQEQYNAIQQKINSLPEGSFMESRC